MSSKHKFLFTSLGDKKPLTARKVHIRRLYDLLQLCIQRNDIVRAKRTWTILLRCKEIDWKSMWSTGIQLLGDQNARDDNANNLSKLAFLRAVMPQCPNEREIILKELVLRLILCGKHREALDELELYLPSFPYQDNPVLHTYAGLLCIFLSQSECEPQDLSAYNPITLRNAQCHLERARALDIDNTVASGFLELIPSLLQISQEKKFRTGEDPGADSDEEPLTSGSSRRQKRIRTEKDRRGRYN